MMSMMMDETGTSLVGVVNDSKATQDFLFSEQESDSSDQENNFVVDENTQAGDNKDQELPPCDDSTKDTSDTEIPRGKPAEELASPLPSPDVSAIVPEATGDHAPSKTMSITYSFLTSAHYF